jgi:hypothetical protein
LENISVSPFRQYLYSTAITDPVGIFASTNTAIPFDAVDSDSSTIREIYVDVGDAVEAYMVTLAEYSAAISTTGDTELFAPRYKVYCNIGLLANKESFKYIDWLFRNSPPSK